MSAAFDFKIGWWVRLKCGACGQITYVAPLGEQGIRLQIDESGTVIDAYKKSVLERVNPYTFCRPRDPVVGRRYPNALERLDAEGYEGRHPADGDYPCL